MHYSVFKYYRDSATNIILIVFIKGILSWTSWDYKYVGRWTTHVENITVFLPSGILEFMNFWHLNFI